MNRREAPQWLRVSPLRPEPGVLDQAWDRLRHGGLLAFPTDTLYGLTCDPRNLRALEALFGLKRRPPSLRIPFIAADAAQAGELVSLEGSLARLAAERFWPGPLSLVLPLSRGERLCRWEWGTSLAIRVPALSLARELAREAGIPLPATSANLSGKPAASSADRIDPAILSGVDLVLDGGPLQGEGAPSTLLDLTSSPPRLLRAGAVSLGALRALPGLGGLAAPNGD